MSGLSVVGHDRWGVFPLRCGGGSGGAAAAAAGACRACAGHPGRGRVRGVKRPRSQPAPASTPGGSCSTSATRRRARSARTWRSSTSSRWALRGSPTCTLACEAGTQQRPSCAAPPASSGSADRLRARGQGGHIHVLTWHCAQRPYTNGCPPQILGLQHGKQYEDVKSLRYGSLMIMTDQVRAARRRARAGLPGGTLSPACRCLPQLRDGYLLATHLAPRRTPRSAAAAAPRTQSSPSFQGPRWQPHQGPHHELHAHLLPEPAEDPRLPGGVHHAHHQGAPVCMAVCVRGGGSGAHGRGVGCDHARVCWVCV